MVKMRKCKFCGKKFEVTDTRKIFCNSFCAGSYHNETEIHKNYVRRYQKKRGVLVKMLKEEHPRIYDTLSENAEGVLE